MQYLPRTLTNFDPLFGEDALSRFDDAVTLEFFVDNVEGWGGEGNFLTKFGLEIRDEATLSVSRRRFAEEVTTSFADITRPREGDLIAFPSPIDRRLRMFEISYVETNEPFMQLGKQYIYKLKLRSFEMNGESFDTGIPTIDSFETANAIATTVQLVSGTGTFFEQETITQTVCGDVVWTGSVVTFIGNQLIISGATGDLNPNLPIVGSISGASWVLSEVTSETANTYAENTLYDESPVIKFDENDPFRTF